MSVLLWIYSIVIVSGMRKGMTSNLDGSEMECFVCNSLLGDLCYDSKALNFSSFTKNCSDYVEVMPNCVYPEDEIATESNSRDSTTMKSTKDISTNEKAVDEARTKNYIDGSGTRGNQESIVETLEPDYENFGYRTFKNYERAPSEVLKPPTTTSAKNATDITENPKLIWEKAENTFDEHKVGARRSALYYCYKLIAISRDGEQFTIRGCTRKARACFTGNFLAVDHYDCTVCGGPLCNAQSANGIFKSIIILWSTQVLLFTIT